ncbi:MAG: tetratricopeptide repeat protein [Isosphaeraceae bacterium]
MACPGGPTGPAAGPRPCPASSTGPAAAADCPEGANRPGGGSGLPGGANRPGGGIAGGNRPGGGNGLPGGINRPGGATTLPGVVNRPGGNGGGINRPGGGLGPNRPGGNGGGIAGGNRPGWNGNGINGNRPGWNGNGINGNRPGGNFPGLNNRPGIGGGNNNNIGNSININNNTNNIVNRPNYGGNNFANINSGWGRPGGGGWGGGGGYGWGRPGWGGGAWGRPGWGAPGWGGAGWGSPGWGGWYHGSWGGSNFGNAFVGGLGWGLGSSLAWGLTNPFLWSGGYGYSAPFGMYGGYGFGVPMVSTYFPTWGATSLMDWGLDSTASSWLASIYSNPYVVQQPIENNTTIIYDYSKPIDVAAPTPAETAVASSQKLFESARDAFKSGDYAQALSLTDQALPQSPNDPVTHEFRALNMFALGRYDEAAQVIYAVLNTGPGWDWSTLVSLYGNADDYTKQLRSLEAAVKAKPDSAPLQFLLGYHYMVQGFSDAAKARFEKVAQLSPNDKLAAQFVKALGKAEEAKADPNKPAEAAAPANEAPPEPPPPPPANLIGIWKTQQAEGQTITLSLRADGTYTWSATTRGRTQSIEGRAGFKDGVLALTQEEGSPLTGKVTNQGNDGFTLQLGEQADAPKLAFTKG